MFILVLGRAKLSNFLDVVFLENFLKSESVAIVPVVKFESFLQLDEELLAKVDLLLERIHLLAGQGLLKPTVQEVLLDAVLWLIVRITYSQKILLQLFSLFSHTKYALLAESGQDFVYRSV